MTINIENTTGKNPIKLGAIIPIKTLEENGFKYACRIGQNNKDFIYAKLDSNEAYIVRELKGHNIGKVQIL